MKIEVIRRWFTDKSTIGGMMLDGRFQCFTLEDRVRRPGVKVYGQTAIPAGEYQLIVNYSLRFKRYMPLLLNVPMFSGVRIHSGNTDKDTEGCILVGNSKGDDVVLQSRLAFAELFDSIASRVGIDESGLDVFRLKEPTTVIVTDEPLTDTRTEEVTTEAG